MGQCLLFLLWMPARIPAEVMVCLFLVQLNVFVYAVGQELEKERPEGCPFK